MPFSLRKTHKHKNTDKNYRKTRKNFMRLCYNFRKSCTFVGSNMNFLKNLSMNDRQNAKLNMAQRVSDTLKRYETAYGKIPPMVEAVAALNADIAAIRDTQKEREAVNVPAFTLEKREAERQMIKPCVKMANALYVIGFATGDKDLLTLHGSNDNSFYRLPDNAALALARRIHDLVHQNAAELADYGIDQSEITALGNLIEAYRAVITKPMDAIGERKQKTTNIVQLLAALDSALYDRLDKLMVLFKHTVPEFYSEYRTARNIIFNVEKRKETAP
jgi:hypothetical protein